MSDPCLGENVSCMVEACKAMGIPVRTCSEVVCDDWFKEAAAKAECSASDLIFAAGYLQATSNITGESWGDQLERVEKEMYANAQPAPTRIR